MKDQKRRQLRGRAEPSDEIWPFLRALVSPGAESLERWLSGNAFGRVLPVCEANRVAPYVFYRLRHENLLSHEPGEVNAALRLAYDTAAAQHLLYRWELAELLNELRPWGVQPILLKGMALGATLYPTPATRPVSDIDLLIRREDVPAFREVVGGRGYRDTGLDPEHRVGFPNHLATSRTLPGGNEVHVEAHWALVHELSRAPRMGFDDLNPRAQEIDMGGFAVRVLDPADQLIHACAHLSLHHVWNWDLLWLLDLRLLVDRYGSTWNWSDVVSRARGLDLVGSIGECLELAEYWYGRFLPDPARQALAAGAASHGEPRSIGLGSSGSPLIWQLVWARVREERNWVRRLAYFRDNLFPPWSYMQYRYGARSRWLAPVYYGWRLVRGAATAFTHLGSG